MRKVEVIVELAQIHGGSVEKALKLIQRVREVGADTAKFQCHEWQQGERSTYWFSRSFHQSEWTQCRDSCHRFGLGFLVSPFTVAAVQLIEPLVSRWKIGSAQVTDTAVLDKIAKYPKPILASDGLCTPLEMKAFKQRFPNLQWLWCASLYPTPPEYLDLSEFAESGFEGISDHSGTIWPSLSAVAQGAQIVEVHVRNEGEYAPDYESILSWRALRRLVEGIRYMERMGTAQFRDTNLWRLQRKKYGMPI